MRKAVLCAMALFMGFNIMLVPDAHAQSKFKKLFTENRSQSQVKHSIGVNPLFLAQGLRVKYETPLTQKISVGGYFTAHMWSGYCNGVMLAPIGRWYFSGEAANYGFYGQVKPLIGFYTYDLFAGKKTFVTGGLGVGVGYQFNFKNPRWSLDLAIGFKGVSGPPDNDSENDDIYTYNDNALDDLSWGTMGAGSFFDGNITICYRF